MINILKNKKIISLIIIAIFITIFLLIYNNNDDKVVAENTQVKKISKSQKKEVVLKDIYVEIKGAVINPGVYKLNENSRVIDLINVAGGLNDNANIDYINQSKILTDQMVIKIYTNQEIEESKKVEIVTKYIEKECNCPKIQNDACLDSNDSNDINSSTGLININTATLEQLLTLPGIGESKAQAIIEYRSSTKFNNIEDLKNIKGIGNNLYDKVKDYIEV